MRCFRTIIGIAVLAVSDRRHDIFSGSAIASELVSYHASWRVTLAFHELAEKPFSCAFVTPFLNKNIDDITVLIDSTPEIVTYAIDCDENLIQEPQITQAPLPLAKFSSVLRAEF